MKKEIKIAPLIYPMPVIMLATFNSDGTVNVMNAAWGAAVDADMIAVCLSEHQTTENFKRNGDVVIQMATSKHIAEADYFGLVSAKRVKDKFAKTSLHYHKAEKVDAPIIEEFPLALECKFIYSDPESGMHYFKILKASAEEDILNDKGVIDLNKADAVLFSGSDGKYYKVGEEAAKAFNIGTKFIKK